MIKRILTICAAVMGGAAASSLALAQGYPVPPASVYSTAPLPYPSGGYPDYRRAPTELDADLLEDDEALPNGQRSTALPPPGPGLSPEDPRYGRPIYSDRSAPTSPILSPDDPRYGRGPHPHRRAGDVLEYLHRERSVAVGFGGAHDRLV